MKLILYTVVLGAGMGAVLFQSMRLTATSANERLDEAEMAAYEEEKRIAEESIRGLSPQRLAYVLDFQIRQALTEGGHMSPVDINHQVRPLREAVIDAMRQSTCSENSEVDAAALEDAARQSAMAELEAETGGPANIDDVARISVAAVRLAVDTAPKLCSPRGLTDLFLD